jgi:putative component of membrane protein insertase Oxa1/YidC/SpoIIIJ protein YidD
MKNRNLISLLFCLVIFLPSKCFYSPWCLQIYALAVSFFCACLGQMLIKLAARTSCHELTCSGEIMLFGPDSQVALSQLWNGLVANWLPQSLMRADLDKFSCRFIGTCSHFKNIYYTIFIISFVCKINCSL